MSDLMRDPPWRSPLCRRIALVALCVLVISELSLAVSNYQKGRADMFEGLRDTARAYLTSAIDRRKFPDNETLVDVGENLLFATNIRGGVFVDAIGEDVVPFGQRPKLTWQMATLRGQAWRYDNARRLYEVYLSPETLGIPHGVLLQLNAKNAHASLLENTKQTLMQGVVVALIAVVIMAMAIGWFAIAPIQRIRRALYNANEKPSSAEDHLVGIQMGTEMDLVGAEIDALLRGLTASYDDERAQRAIVFEHTGPAMLIYSDQGKLVDANREALSLFDVETFEELAAREQNKLIHIGGYLRSPQKMFARGRYSVSGDAVVDGTFIPCLISGDTIHRADGTTRGNFIVLTNVEQLVKDMRRERRNRERVEVDLGQARHRMNEYRQLFESCLVLLDAKETQPPKMRITLMPEELVNAWFKENVTNNVMQKGDLRHTALPPTIGCPQQMKKIVNNALTVVHRRSVGQDDVLITVTSAISGDADLDIIIRAVEGHETGPTTMSAEVGDVPLLIAGLSRMLPAGGGRLLRTADPADPSRNELAFRIPLDVDTFRASNDTSGADTQQWMNA
ncbi:MAG: PAS domain-containing protein [Pseudomonadota bacterium]